MSILRAAAAILVLTISPAMATPKTGEPAPEFTAVDSAGKSHKLADFKGKTVILEWTNDGCPYVKKHYGSGNMQTLQKDLTAKGVVWLTVISSAPGEQGHVDGPGADKLSQARGAVPTAVLLDPEGTLGRLYDARTTPHMYIITADGKLAYQGAIDDKPSSNPADIPAALNLVRNALDLIAEGKPVNPATTKSYGCSVKYKS
jgi:peroxiredoxin